MDTACSNGSSLRRNEDTTSERFKRGNKKIDGYSDSNKNENLPDFSSNAEQRDITWMKESKWKTQCKVSFYATLEAYTRIREVLTALEKDDEIKLIKHSYKNNAGDENDAEHQSNFNEIQKNDKSSNQNSHANISDQSSKDENNIDCNRMFDDNNVFDETYSNSSTRSSSSNSMIEDLIPEHLFQMKRDQKGNYTHCDCWISDILISMSKVRQKGFTDELEQNYRLLSETSKEHNMRICLIQHNFIDLAEFLLRYFVEPSKLIEITLGILANICYEYDAIILLSKRINIMRTVYEFLKYSDSLILTHVTRLIQCAVWRKVTFLIIWEDVLYESDFEEHIIFILKTSCCSDLLRETMFLVYYMSQTASICNITLVKLFKRKLNILYVISGLLECFLKIIKLSENSHSPKDMRFIKYWLRILECLALEDLSLITFTFEEKSSKWIDIINRLLRPYKRYKQLKPNDCFLIKQTMMIIEKWHAFDTKIPEEVNQCLVYITCNIDIGLKKVTSNESDTDESDTNEPNKTKPDINKLLSELYTDTNHYWLNRILILEKDEIIKVMRPLKSWACKYLVKLISYNEIKHTEFLKIKDIITGCSGALLFDTFKTESYVMKLSTNSFVQVV